MNPAVFKGFRVRAIEILVSRQIAASSHFSKSINDGYPLPGTKNF